MTPADLSDLWLLVLGIVPAFVIGGAVVFTDAKRARSSSITYLSLTMRAERAEKQVEELKEWAREHNHGILPSTAGLQPIESPVRITLRRLTNPLRTDVMSGWFLVRLESDHTAWTKDAEEWNGDPSIVARLGECERRKTFLERELRRTAVGRKALKQIA